MRPVRSRRPDRGRPSAYRGTAGFRERWLVAVLDDEQRIIERLSPAYATPAEGFAAWLTRRDRRGRLVRLLTFAEVVA